jgi:hypothetical protein
MRVIAKNLFKNNICLGIKILRHRKLTWVIYNQNYILYPRYLEMPAFPAKSLKKIA